MDIFWITLIVLCILNIAVSFFLSRRDDLETVQKIAQTIIVWLIPFLGAVGLWLFNRSQDAETSKPQKGEFGGGSANSNYVNSGD